VKLSEVEKCEVKLKYICGSEVAEACNTVITVRLCNYIKNECVNVDLIREYIV